MYGIANVRCDEGPEFPEGVSPRPFSGRSF